MVCDQAAEVAEESHHDSRAAGVLRASSDHVLAVVRVSNDRVLAVNHSREAVGVVRNADDVRRILVTLFRSNLLRNLFPLPARQSSAQCLTRRI